MNKRWHFSKGRRKSLKLGQKRIVWRRGKHRAFYYIRRIW